MNYQKRMEAYAKLGLKYDKPAEHLKEDKWYERVENPFI
jgi:hypothetical protein